jgi:hypothetical protein
MLQWCGMACNLIFAHNNHFIQCWVVVLSLLISVIIPPLEHQNVMLLFNWSRDEIVDFTVERKTIVIPSANRSKQAETLPAGPGNRDEVIDAPVERKTLVIPSTNRVNVTAEPPSFTNGSSNDDGQAKKYYPSETCRLVQEQEAGVTEVRINPLTGAEIKTSQSRTLLMLDRALE